MDLPSRAAACLGPGWSPLDEGARPVEFSGWETAWVRAGGQQGVLLPGLRDRSEIRILSASVDGQVVAGVAANESGSLVQISNFFADLPAPRTRGKLP